MLFLFIRVAHGSIGLLRNKIIYLHVSLLEEILTNYNLRSVNNIGVDQSALMRTLVCAFIVRKPTTFRFFSRKGSNRQMIFGIQFQKIARFSRFNFRS